MHLSRFHLDRIVTATGGEPPGRMRRRLLLERAAYQLAVSDRSVLDVAIEAGFDSHEGFTRAFRREYGAAPSRWRRHPTRTQLPAPSRVHFHPPGTLRLPTTTKVTPMDLLTRMIEHHLWLTGEMLERAGRLTDAQLDAPIEVSVGTIDDDMSIRSVLGRLVGQLAQWNAASSQRGYDWDERGKTVADAAPRARRGGARLPRPGAAAPSRRVGSTTPSSTSPASPPGCSPTAGWWRTC